MSAWRVAHLILEQAAQHAVGDRNLPRVMPSRSRISGPSDPFLCGRSLVPASSPLAMKALAFGALSAIKRALNGGGAPAIGSYSARQYAGEISNLLHW